MTFCLVGVADLPLAFYLMKQEKGHLGFVAQEDVVPCETRLD